MRQHNDATKTSITRRLRNDLGQTVRVTNCHPTGVVKPVYGIITFQLTAKALQSKAQTFQKKLIISLIKTEDKRQIELLSLENMTKFAKIGLNSSTFASIASILVANVLLNLMSHLIAKSCSETRKKFVKFDGWMVSLYVVML